MKKISFFSIAVIALAGLFCGCSNITEAKSEAAESDTMVVKLALDEMRAIKAVEYNVSDVKDWTLTFTGTILGTEKTYGFSTTANDEDSKAVWDNSSSFTVKKIPTGTYSLKITGNGTDSSSKSFTLCGSKTGFTVSADSVTNDAVDIHLKSESTGKLSLTLSTENLTDNGSLTANNIGYFKAVLTPAGGVNNGEAVELTSADGISVDNSGNVGLYKEAIPSGWYVLKFEFNDGTNQYKYRINEYNVQIADDIITTATETLFCVTQETYYATNSTSTYNGKSKAYPANLTNLLGNLASSLPEVTDVSIYMTDADEDAEIDVAALTELQIAFSKNIDEKKYTSISIYNSSDTENAVLLVNNSNSDVTGVETVISGSVTVSATDNNTDFAVSSVTPAASSMIVTLKNGAVLNTQSINFNNSSIAFRAVDSAESADNFTAYVSSPFVTYLSTDADSIEKSLLLYAYNGTAALDTWSCICKEETTGSDSDATTTYSVYTVPASGATSSIVNLAETAVITAADDSSSYTSGSKITYTDADLTFSLSGLEGVEPSSYQWQLNGSVVGTESTLVLNPTEAEAILPDEENALACYIVVNSTVYIAEMTFTFKADYNTNAVYVDSESSESSSKSVKQVAYDDSSAKGTEVVTGTFAYYTFDAEGNMYVATWGNSLSLYKYVKTVSSGNFSSIRYVFNEFTDITTQPAYADICYDTVNDLVYVLWTIADTSNNTTTYTSKVYAFTCSDTAFTSVADTEVSVPEAYTSTIAGNFSQIAVNGSDVYLADADLNVLKVDFSVSQTESGVTVTPGTPSVLILGTVLKTTVGIDSTKYDSSNWDSSEITDLIVGDGCGNESSTLYALVREASSSIYGGGDNDKYYFSRGALLAFDTLSTAVTPTVYGWSKTETKLTQATDSTLCAPLYSETGAFYGPVHFACVMPKKLVIADDGFATKDSTGADENLYNKDGFVVFDIEASSLTYQKAFVTMSKPKQANYSSTFTIN